MILMKTDGNLSFPNSAPAELVDVATLRHQNVSSFKTVLLNFFCKNSNGLDDGKVEVTILNVGDTKIG